MAYLLQTIIDELMQYDIKPLINLSDFENLTSNDFILKLDNPITITIENFDSWHNYSLANSYKYYLVPSNLISLNLIPFEIIDIIWHIFDNICANKIHLEKESKTRIETNGNINTYLRFDYSEDSNLFFTKVIHIYFVKICNISKNSSNSSIILHTPKKKLKSIIINELKQKKLSYITILYKL